MASDVEVDNKILYDLSVHSEWLQDSETVIRTREKNNVTLPRRIASITSRTAWTVLRAIGFGSGAEFPCLLPAGLVKLVSSQINWHFAVTPDGRQVAVLQDQDVEVRSIHDDFATVTGRACVHARDAYPQWRRVAWSNHGDLLACSDSVGSVYVYDTMCTPVCTIQCGWSPSASEPADLSRAVCSLIFTQSKLTNCVAELWVINHQGTLKKYAISVDGSPRLLHTFSFSAHYPQGISAVVYQPKFDLLLVGGCGDMEPADEMTDAQAHGLTAWRVLSSSPHYKLVTDLEQDRQQARRKQMRVLRRLKSMSSMRWWYGKEQDGVYSMTLSPGGQLLGTVHYSGRFSLWHVPSLTLKHTWPLDGQPGHDEVNQAVAENPKRRKNMKEQLKAFWLADSNWWSDQAVILARGTGAVTVSDVDTLQNLLGTHEWFEPAPRLSHTSDTGFLSLEAECKYQSLKRHISDSSEGSGSDDDYEDSEDENDLDLISRSTRYVKYSLYYVTDIERFQPPRKKPKMVTRTYRLLCLKSTTPEELYTRKIENEEYGEALMLARAYGLDCDRVYQRQWRKTQVSVASIQDYLSKIRKRAWVLHECLERVPENIDAMRELLQYGLRGTDLEALITIGKGEDQGRFIVCDRFSAYEESIESFNEDSQEQLKAKEKEHQQQLLKDMDFEKLSLEQRELCRARSRLLQYLDRLSTYEEILGGIYVAADRYNATFFEEFRAKNIVELAADYARKCDWRAVDTLFFYHGEQLLPHRLAILANFPETFPPAEYANLLPEADTLTDSVVPVRQGSWREQDWVEEETVRLRVDPTVMDYGAFLYEECPEYTHMRGELKAATLTEWYIHRATEIEDFSRQVDHALELIKLGRERGVDGLDTVYDALLTLNTLVYECCAEDSLSLADIQTMPHIDQLRLIMMRSSEDMYVRNVRRWLVPFLQRLDEHQRGAYDALLGEYMVTMARTDLTQCLSIFEASKSHQRQPVIGSETQLISLALECIYACEASDQLANAFSVLECLPQRGFGLVSEEMGLLHNQVDELECHLSAAEILAKHELPHTVAFIRGTQKSEADTVALLRKLTRVSGRREPSEEEWRELLLDILALRDKGFHAVTQTQCYQIFVESLLTSGRHEDILLAGKLIEASKQEAEQPDYQQLDNEEYGAFEKVAYAQAVEQVLNAAREYFDSSANLADSNMDLARACLKLIQDTPAEITRELDLIDALSLLDGFGVSVLPLQVRMCNDHTEIIKQALQEKSYTYKNSQRLLKLATLMHLHGANTAQREGVVLTMVAEEALSRGDEGVAYDTCLRLLQLNHAPAWEQCVRLAECETFTDIRAKVDLLSFAVTHCSGHMIEPVLRAKCLLQAQINCEILQEEARGRDSQSPPPQPSLSASGAIQQTKAILSSTNKVTKSVLSHVSDGKWWSRTLKNMQRPLTTAPPDDSDALHAGNAEFTHTACHPFYASIMGDCYENRAEVDYGSLRMPRADAGVLRTSEGVLRTSKLEETLVEGETFHPATEVLLQLAEDTLQEDTTLGLAYLLALPKAQEADKVFEKLPKSGVSLELMTYYYALQIYEHLRSDVTAHAHIDPVYMHKPEEVTRRVLRLVKRGQADKNEDVRELTQRLISCHERLLDFSQGHSLQELGRGVDVARFAEDSVYKQETILGLAMSGEQPVYEIAVSLAKRYNLSMWEVHMTHLEFLFESGLSVEEIEKRVERLDLLGSLKQEPAQLKARLQRYVWPMLCGTDHAMLLYYYTLLQHAATGGGAKEGESKAGPGKEMGTQEDPEMHTRLLKRIMTIASDVDYKRLIDPKENPLDVIRPVLNSSNINQIAKLASKIPCGDGTFLQPSLVYCAWALKQFWEGTTSKKSTGAASTPQSHADWVHRYESCHEFINKLAAPDFVQFCDNVIFEQKSLDSLSVETRQEVVKRALKFCRQQQTKNKLQPEAWKEACDHLQEAQKHLSLMTSEFFVNLHQSDDADLRKYARLFDLSKSKDEKVRELLMTVAMDGQPVEFIREFLHASPLSSYTTATVVKDALRVLTGSLRNTEERSALLSNRDELTVLKSVIGQVSAHIENWGEEVELEDVLCELRPFCADACVLVETRLDVLRMLEQCFQLDDADTSLLLLYRTQAIVTSQWPEVKLSEESVAGDGKREELFDDLLSRSDTAQHFTALTTLLQVWPPLKALSEKSKEPDKHPFCRLVTTCVRLLENTDTVLALCRNFKQTHSLSEECLEFTLRLLVDKGHVLTGVKCALLFEQPKLHEKCVECLRPLSEVGEDEELIRLLLQRHLLSNLVSTCLYERAINHVLDHQADTAQQTPYYLQVENLCYQLSEDGHPAEAGALLARYRGLHPMLTTFDSAFSVVSRWLTKS